jgi:hypothetical protein
MSTQAPTSNDPKTPAAPTPARRLRIDFRQYGILAALVIIIGLFQVLTGGRLLMPGNVNNLIQQNAYVVILAIGMVMVIIAGHIDLSVGSVVAMVGAIAALAMNSWHLPWWLAVVLALVVGAVLGAWQGFWVAFMGIPARSAVCPASSSPSVPAGCRAGSGPPDAPTSSRSRSESSRAPGWSFSRSPPGRVAAGSPFPSRTRPPSGAGTPSPSPRSSPSPGNSRTTPAPRSS